MPRHPKCIICDFVDIKTRGFFHFPKEREQFQKWNEALELETKPEKHDLVCYKHFKKGDLFWTDYMTRVKKGK